MVFSFADFRFMPGFAMFSPARFIDHTLLKSRTTTAEIRQLCEEAVEYGFTSVCVPPCQVRLASSCLYGSEVAVGTVIGFPLGYETTASKLFATREAVAAGAAEIDMVINQGLAADANWTAIQQEVSAVVSAAEGALVKVILECCLHDDPAKRRLTELVAASGAAFVKTSTGFAEHGATVSDVRLMVEAAAGRIGGKASGGIRDWATCRAFLDAGATRIGTSSGVAILEQWRSAEGG